MTDYWLVDEVMRSIEVFRGLESIKRSKTLATSVVADGFTVDVKKLLKS